MFFFAGRQRKKTIGDAGEKIAADELIKRGFKIVAKNWRGGGGEIDLIAWDKKELVFVEVKTRSNKKFGNPEEGVGTKKIRGMTKAAVAFCAENKIRNTVCRGDIIAIMLTEPSPEIVHFQDAIPIKIFI